jgi:hypothetical protein
MVPGQRQHSNDGMFQEGTYCLTKTNTEQIARKFSHLARISKTLASIVLATSFSLQSPWRQDLGAPRSKWREEDVLQALEVWLGKEE